MKKIIFGILVALFAISCEKEDGLLVENEQIEASELAGKREIISPIKPVVKFCRYTPLRVVFHAGSYSGCELYDRMNKVRAQLSLETDPLTGCPKYKIPAINYFNCQFLNSSSYVEEWSVVLNCNYYGTDQNGNNVCVDENGIPIEPGNQLDINMDTNNDDE